MDDVNIPELCECGYEPRGTDGEPVCPECGGMIAGRTFSVATAASLQESSTPAPADPKDHMEQMQAWRDAGWLVRVTFLPDGLPFTAQGSASELAPSPDVTLEGTEGYVACELSWLHWDRDPPTVYRWPTPRGIGPTVASAVTRCAEALERNRRQEVEER